MKSNPNSGLESDKIETTRKLRENQIMLQIRFDSIPELSVDRSEFHIFQYSFALCQRCLRIIYLSRVFVILEAANSVQTVQVDPTFPSDANSIHDKVRLEVNL